MEGDPERSRTLDTATAKSAAANKWEGILLTALQGFPAFTGSGLLLKLFDARMVGQPFGAVIFVMTACGMLGLVTPWLAPKFPKGFRNYEPLFFDATLSIRQKVEGWLAKPETSKQLLQMVFMLAVLAIAVMTVR
jgi:hypothetical protein